jgi:hypothetical protein
MVIRTVQGLGLRGVALEHGIRVLASLSCTPVSNSIRLMVDTQPQCCQSASVNSRRRWTEARRRGNLRTFPRLPRLLPSRHGPHAPCEQTGSANRHRWRRRGRGRVRMLVSHFAEYFEAVMLRPGIVVLLADLLVHARDGGVLALAQQRGGSSGHSRKARAAVAYLFIKTVPTIRGNGHLLLYRGYC